LFYQIIDIPNHNYFSTCILPFMRYIYIYKFCVKYFFLLIFFYCSFQYKSILHKSYIIPWFSPYIVITVHIYLTASNIHICNIYLGDKIWFYKGSETWRVAISVFSVWRSFCILTLCVLHTVITMAGVMIVTLIDLASTCTVFV
jgi:hypothetical protein